MKKTKSILVVLLCLLFVTLVAACFIRSDTFSASAEADDGYTDAEDWGSMADDADSEIMPLLFTSLNMSLYGENGVICTTVSNAFTLFPSKVYVIALLYSSDTYCESYTEMTLTASNSTTDLDMGTSITASASTEGRTRFWLARARWSTDASTWKEKSLGPIKFNGDGEDVGLT